MCYKSGDGDHSVINKGFPSKINLSIYSKPSRNVQRANICSQQKSPTKHLKY